MYVTRHNDNSIEFSAMKLAFKRYHNCCERSLPEIRKLVVAMKFTILYYRIFRFGVNILYSTGSL